MGEIDVLTANTTWTLSREASGVNFTIPNYYDYTGILLRKDLGATKVQDLKGASVCVQSGTTTVTTISDISKQYAIDLKTVAFDSAAALRQAFFSGRCDLMISDGSALAGARAMLAKNPNDYTVIKLEDRTQALTPAVRRGDDQWFAVVKWSFEAMLEAEDLGITQKNVDQMLKSPNASVRRLLGVDPGIGKALGLSDKWAYNVIKQVGNYGEVYDRTVGSQSALKIERGPNRLSRNGGLMFPLSFY